MPQMALIPRVAKFAPKRPVPMATAAGRVAGETIATYPPGVPIIAAGEILEPRSHSSYLREMQRYGASAERCVGPRVPAR